MFEEYVIRCRVFRTNAAVDFVFTNKHGKNIWTDHPPHYERIKECCKEWAEENFGDDRGIYFWRGTGRLIVEFTDMNKAIAFKLRFC